MLTVKIGYAEAEGVLVLSAKDADDKLFPAVFLDAKKIIAAKKAAFQEVVDCAVTNHSVGPDSKFAKISLRCSGARPLSAA